MPAASPRLAVLVLLSLPLLVAPLPGVPGAAASGERAGNDWSRVLEPLAGPPRIIGGAAHGCIAGAEELPPDGPGYEAIRLSRHRNFGHPDLVAFVERLGRRAQQAGLPAFYVGDMAQPRGGPLPYGHASHQTGIDVDIWFTLAPKTWLPPAQREEVDLPSMLLANYHEIDPRRWGARQVELVKLAATDPAVDRIFVNAVIKAALCRSVLGSTPAERAWLERVRPWYGHDEHFHVRLRCPAGQPGCEEQAPVPEGDGCGAELASWLRHLPPPPPENAGGHHPVLPGACRGVLLGK